MRLILPLLFFLFTTELPAQLTLSENSDEMAELITDKLKYKEFTFKSLAAHYGANSNIADSLKVDQIRIADLNHDGVNDLFAMGFATTKKRETEFEDVIIAVSDRKRLIRVDAKNYFFTNWFVRAPIYPRIIEIDNLDYLFIQYKLDNDGCEEIEGEFQSETLYVKNNFLIPKDKYINSDFSSVTLKTTPCYGTCPVFELTINKDGAASFNGINHTKTRGSVNLKAEKEDVEFLNEILKVIDFERLKSNYAVCWTDDQTGHLTVSFTDGSSYEIEDYGLAGTHRLTLLYNYLYDLADF